MIAKQRFAVLGHPVSHSVSPAMHRAALKALKMPHTYEAIDVPNVDRLKELVVALRQGFFTGLNITVPHKRNVVALADRADDSVTQLGAANTLVWSKGRVLAYNTDVAGLADDLRSLGARGRTAAIIGAGGGASAAVAACAMLGAKLIAVTSRSWPSSEALVSSESAERLRAMGALPCAWPALMSPASASKLSEVLRLQWQDIAASSDIVIQATSAGMKGADPGNLVADIVPWKRLRADAMAYDLVYNPPETTFLRAAREAGIAHANGLGMLVRQGAQAFSLWLKATPDLEVMRHAAERALQGGP